MIENRFEVTNGNGMLWFFASRPKEAEEEAIRIRALHRQLPIAFPLPITVSVVQSIDKVTVHRKRISGSWEQPCECCA